MRAVLDDAAVLLGRANQLASLPQVVRTGFFDVHVLAGLTCPNRHQRVPMVGRGNRHRVDRLVVEQPADIRHGSRPSTDFAEALVEHRLVDITQGSNLDTRDAGKRIQVIFPAPLQAADGDADTIVGAKDALRSRQECDPAHRRHACRRPGCALEKVPPRHI